MSLRTLLSPLGVQYSVRDFVDVAAKELGMDIRWEGQGVDEVDYLHPPYSQTSPAKGEGKE